MGPTGHLVAGEDRRRGLAGEGREVAAFDGVMCMDAMEHVPPEEWPTVVAAFRRALRPNGHLLVTLEEIDQKEIDEAFAAAGAEGSPALRGEVVEGDTAGYHFYPGRERADRWLADGGFSPVADDDEWLDGYGYRHMLLRVED